MHVTEWTSVVSAVAAAAGFLAVVFQLRKAVKDGRTAELRRRREATISFYTDTLLARTQLGEHLPPDHDPERIEELVSKATHDDEAHDLVRSYLNYWELLANAVRLDVFDFSTIDTIAGFRVMQVARHYDGYIRSTRESLGVPTLYEGLQGLARRVEQSRE